MQPNLHLVRVLNCPTDLLVMANTLKGSLDVYDISHRSAVIEQTAIESRLIYRVNNFKYNPNTEFYRDDDFVFYKEKGNLIRIDFENDKIENIDFSG